MRRICLCLLMLMACVDVAAREVRLSSPDSGGAAATAVAPAPKPAARRAAPQRDDAADTRVRPALHSDVGSGPRARWHSFLPGMFR